jgi:hypothetical protein
VGGSFVHGVVLGPSSPPNLENFLLEDCSFSSFIDYGFFIQSGSGQSKHHQIRKCGFSGGKRHIMVNTGSFQAWACDFQSATEAAIWIGNPTDHIVIGDFMSENCARFIVSGTLDEVGGGAPWAVSLIGGRAAPNLLHADGRFVVLRNAGPYIIQNCGFDRFDDHENFKIVVGNLAKTVADFRGCVFPSGTRDVITGALATVTITSCAGDSGSGRVDINDQKYRIDSVGVKHHIYESTDSAFSAFGATPSARPVVTGARMDALSASLVDAMGVLGWVQNATRTPLQIFGGDLWAWFTFDAENLIIADTDRISQANDLSGNDRHISAATTRRPTVSALADGRASGQWLNSEDRHLSFTGAVADYKWLHDGSASPFLAFCVELPATGTPSQPLFDNIRGNAGVSGLNLGAGLGAALSFDCLVANGTGTPYLANNVGATTAGPIADVPIVTWSGWGTARSPLMSTWMNVPSPVEVRTDDVAAGSPSASNPNWAPAIGNLALGGASRGINAKIRHIVMLQRQPTADEQEALLWWMETA